MTKEPGKSSAAYLKEHLDADLSPTAITTDLKIDLDRNIKSVMAMSTKSIAARKSSMTRLNDASAKPLITVVNKSKIKLPPRPVQTSLAATQQMPGPTSRPPAK